MLSHVAGSCEQLEQHGTVHPRNVHLNFAGGLSEWGGGEAETGGEREDGEGEGEEEEVVVMAEEEERIYAVSGSIQVEWRELEDVTSPDGGLPDVVPGALASQQGTASILTSPAHPQALARCAAFAKDEGVEGMEEVVGVGAGETMVEESGRDRRIAARTSSDSLPAATSPRNGCTQDPVTALRAERCGVGAKWDDDTYKHFPLVVNWGSEDDKQSALDAVLMVLHDKGAAL